MYFVSGAIVLRADRRERKIAGGDAVALHGSGARVTIVVSGWTARVRSWHETDMPTLFRNVRSQGQSGKHVLALSFSGFDPKADVVPSPSVPI